jgi:hypothetical protein
MLVGDDVLYTVLLCFYSHFGVFGFDVHVAGNALMHIMLSSFCRHTGVYVYGNEYYFGGGIQSSPGGNTPYGRPCKTIELGFTQIPKEMFEDYLQEISPRYTALTYNLLHHNCNNFSEEVCQFLLGVSIPNYILSLPSEIMNSPMGALICKFQYLLASSSNAFDHPSMILQYFEVLLNFVYW